MRNKSYFLLFKKKNLMIERLYLLYCIQYKRKLITKNNSIILNLCEKVKSLSSQSYEENYLIDLTY